MGATVTMHVPVSTSGHNKPLYLSKHIEEHSYKNNHNRHLYGAIYLELLFRDAQEKIKVKQKSPNECHIYVSSITKKEKFSK